jgi:hypothetical protein
MGGGLGGGGLGGGGDGGDDGGALTDVSTTPPSPIAQRS